jgi:hypothetical protein
VKCQSWVDPAKFNKKGLPTPRSLIGTHLMIPDIALSCYDKQPKQRAKLAEAIKRMVRCGGRVEFSMSPEYDEGGDTGNIDAGIQCSLCGETSHPVVVNSETVERWIQERLDAMA